MKKYGKIQSRSADRYHKGIRKEILKEASIHHVSLRRWFEIKELNFEDDIDWTLNWLYTYAPRKLFLRKYLFKRRR